MTVHLGHWAQVWAQNLLKDQHFSKQHYANILSPDDYNVLWWVQHVFCSHTQPYSIITVKIFKLLFGLLDLQYKYRHEHLDYSAEAVDLLTYCCLSERCILLWSQLLKSSVHTPQALRWIAPASFLFSLDSSEEAPCRHSSHKSLFLPQCFPKIRFYLSIRKKHINSSEYRKPDWTVFIALNIEHGIKCLVFVILFPYSLIR